jgi:hypothetical protein
MLEIVFANLKRVFKKRLLGRCGARYTAGIICAPPSVVPCTARLLTTRMSKLLAHPIRQNPSARLGDGADSRVPGNRLKMILK